MSKRSVVAGFDPPVIGPHGDCDKISVGRSTAGRTAGRMRQRAPPCSGGTFPAGRGPVVRRDVPAGRGPVVRRRHRRRPPVVAPSSLRRHRRRDVAPSSPRRHRRRDVAPSSPRRHPVVTRRPVVPRHRVVAGRGPVVAVLWRDVAPSSPRRRSVVAVVTAGGTWPRRQAGRGPVVTRRPVVPRHRVVAGRGPVVAPSSPSSPVVAGGWLARSARAAAERSGGGPSARRGEAAQPGVRAWGTSQTVVDDERPVPRLPVVSFPGDRRGMPGVGRACEGFAVAPNDTDPSAIREWGGVEPMT